MRQLSSAIAEAAETADVAELEQEECPDVVSDLKQEEWPAAVPDLEEEEWPHIKEESDDDAVSVAFKR